MGDEVGDVRALAVAVAAVAECRIVESCRSVTRGACTGRCRLLSLAPSRLDPELRRALGAAGTSSVPASRGLVMLASAAGFALVVDL